MFGCRRNVHGVNIRKIKRMLDTYEHNVTAQSLFASLQSVGVSNDSTRFDVSSNSLKSAADSCAAVQSSLLVSGPRTECILSASSPSYIISSDCLVSEAVSSCELTVASSLASSLCANGSVSLCSESVVDSHTAHVTASVSADKDSSCVNAESGESDDDDDSANCVDGPAVTAAAAGETVLHQPADWSVCVDSIGDDTLCACDVDSAIDHLHSDDFTVVDTQMNNSVIHRDSGLRATELRYWGPTDTNDALISCDDETEVCRGTSGHSSMIEQCFSGVDDQTPMIEPCLTGVGPKPQQRRLQKKRLSSLMQSILVGKGWASDCGCPAADQSDSSSPSQQFELCDTQHSLVSAEYQSDFTQTEPCDFIASAKAANGEDVMVTVVKTSPRTVSSPLSLTDHQPSLKVPFRIMLHKSCATADEMENTEHSSQLSSLAACFPTVTSDDLQELLTSCDNDAQVVADLLLEFGYEYNEPRDDVVSSSSSHTNSSSCCSPDRPLSVERNSPNVKETKSGTAGRKNTPTLYRLCREVLISKGVRTMQPRRQLQVPINAQTSGFNLCVHFYFQYSVD